MVYIIFTSIIAIALLIAVFSSSITGIVFNGFVKVCSLIIAPLIVASGVLFSSGYEIGSEKIGVVVRHVGENLPAGKIIAMNGEQGTQAEILGPGWHFGYWPVVYSVFDSPVMNISQGKIGFVTALDGKELAPGSIYADPWDSPVDMLNPVSFLKGHGQRGPQITILPPGSYRYNPALHKIDVIEAVTVDPGCVSVIKSNTGNIVTNIENGGDSVNGVMLVNEGYRGIWKKPLTPGSYYLNTKAYNLVTVKTTNRIYTYQAANLRQSDGSVSKKKQDQNNQNSDWSISVRSKDGFNFPIDVRVSCSVSAQDAPYLVALLGDPDSVVRDDQEDEKLEVLESKIVLPTIRSVLRNVAENMNALEFVNSRSKVASIAGDSVRKEFAKSRVILHEVFIGNIHMDATEQGRKLMDTQTEKEVALNQLGLFTQQQLAEGKRAEFVKAKAEADKQEALVDSQFKISISENAAKSEIAKAKGEAIAEVERAKGNAEAQAVIGEGRAKGYEAMVKSLGQTTFAQLESIRAIADGKIMPGVITPQILINGNGTATDALTATMLRSQMEKK